MHRCDVVADLGRAQPADTAQQDLTAVAGKLGDQLRQLKRCLRSVEEGPVNRLTALELDDLVDQTSEGRIGQEFIQPVDGLGERFDNRTYRFQGRSDLVCDGCEEVLQEGLNVDAQVFNR